MAVTMKAAVVHEFGAPLVIEDVPIPEPGPGQILVKLEACGGVPHRLARQSWRVASQT